MSKRSKSKVTKTSFSAKNKVSIEPVEEIREMLEDVKQKTIAYPKLEIRAIEQVAETAAAREMVQRLRVEITAENGMNAEIKEGITDRIKEVIDRVKEQPIVDEADNQAMIELIAEENAELKEKATLEEYSEPCSLDEEEVLDLDPGDYGEDKYLTIKQLATILQVELSTIRHWEKEFAEFLGQAVLKNQRKRFTQRQLEVFTKIKELLKTEQYTIDGAKRRLELDNILSSSLGVEHNFKTTVFIMLSAIMQELQASRQESRELARQVAKLQVEKHKVEEQLQEEQNKGLLDFLKTKLNKKNPVDKEA
ncbi:MAG: MerR family transcriptional regulator [Clostridia bacterium]|nr:MerR family transcriptional regulator [Clostridia bacterium]